MHLMALGPFRFSVPTYSIEEMDRSLDSRVAPQPIIQGAPRHHLLGPGDETIKLKSTFYPFHLNGGGLGQLEGVRAACRAQSVMPLIGANGVRYGSFVIEAVDNNDTYYHPNGTAQKIETNLFLIRYNGARGLGLSFSIGIF